MIVLGEAKNNKYICEISHTEIEKFLNLYYNNLARLKVGQKIDLGKGYEFHSRTKDALKKTQEFFKSHVDVIRAITDGLLIINTDKGEEAK